MSSMHDLVQSRFQLREQIDFYPRSGDGNLHAKTLNRVDNRFFQRRMSLQPKIGT